MKGMTYKTTGDSVQLSFKYKGHENLAVTDVASISSVLGVAEVMLSLVVAAHVHIGTGLADTTDMVLPAGVWPLSVNITDTISVLQLVGSIAGQASIIKVEG